MKQLRKFKHLTSGERQLLINTFVLLGLVRLGLYLLPFQTLQRIIATISQVKSEHQQVDPTDLGKIVRAVNISSRYMPGDVKCLARALTTQVLMSRHGFLPELRIGVAKGKEGQLEAHAWVENQGQVVIGQLRNLSRFTPMPSWQGGKL